MRAMGRGADCHGQRSRRPRKDRLQGAENWRRAEGSPPYPYWRDAATGEAQNFFIFGIVAWEKATGRATEQRREDTGENDKEGYG